MLGKRNHSMTMNYFLWSSFYINLILFSVAIIWNNTLMIIGSLLFSLLILLIHKKHQLFYANIYQFEGNSETNVSFFQYLKNLVRKEESVIILEKEIEDKKTTVEFTPNPNPSKKEGVLHASSPVKVKNKEFKVKLGNSQSKHKYDSPIVNIDIPNYTLLNYEVIGGLNLASEEGAFSLAIQDPVLDKWNKSNVILKFPINKEAMYYSEREFDELFKELSSHNSVRAIELVYDQSFDSCYSIRDMMDQKNNSYFNDYVELCNFLQKLKKLSNGKPIGIRTGISEKSAFVQLCKTMSEQGIYLDFITIIGDDANRSTSSGMELNQLLYSRLQLEEAVSFASRVIRKFNLESEVKICAAGQINNGFDLLKLIALGSDFCTVIKTQRYFDQISDNYFHEDPEVVVKNNLLYTHKNIVREAVQIMEDAGFSSMEKVDPKMFFRRVNVSTMKNFDEIYLKRDYLTMVEDFRHLN